MNAQLNYPAEPRGLLALVQLGRRAREAASVAELSFIAVNETRQLLTYRQAALWRGDLRQEVLAVSGAAQLDPSAPYLQWLRRLFKAVGRDPQVQRLSAGQLPPLIGEEWSQWFPSHGLLIPLSAPKSRRPAALLLAREVAWRDDEIELSSEVGCIYGHALSALDPREPWSFRLQGILRSRRWLVCVALLLVAVSCIPIRLSVLMPAEITPIDAFVVRAPLEGVIDRFQIRPDETVTTGSALFNLDTTALETRHATAREAYATAREQYRQSAQLAVMEDKPKMEMSINKGLLDEKAVDLAYTESQLQRVQVKAARSGVAVFSDVHEWMGRAVAIGEKVMVIADPTKVELTARMPIGDQVAIEIGAEILFYPKAAPFSSYIAIIDSVAYQAEPHDDVLAYRIRAHFRPGIPLPRLGLMGSARAYAKRVPLIYAILRRPLTVARQWFGW
jgi:multidrug resistance efflux pump